MKINLFCGTDRGINGYIIIQTAGIEYFIRFALNSLSNSFLFNPVIKRVFYFVLTSTK
jgi:hypothetical protein